VARLLVATAAVSAAAGCGAGTGAPPVAAAPGTPPAAISSAAPLTAAVPTLAQPVAGTDPAPGTCSAFSLSLVSDRGGRPTPVAAAEWFSAHGGVDRVPPAGWQEDGTDETGATVRSGAVRLHAVQGPDGTWQVDSGTWC
jgi:hypothetical protein